ncbi:MAG TPA: DUF1840 domain-containing protein [Albitalea sp.]|nr:DUF1840 domain-containing protein [Albitalea sp.]
MAWDTARRRAVVAKLRAGAGIAICSAHPAGCLRQGAGRSSHSSSNLMLYKFKSRATAPLIMLGRNGERVLRIIGKSPDTHGIIESAEMPQAIDLLNAAIEYDDAVRAERHPDGDGPDPEDHPDDEVSLRQRAWPLIEMMERSHSGEYDIVWTASVPLATAAPTPASASIRRS